MPKTVTPFTGESSTLPAASHPAPTRGLGRQNKLAAQLLGLGYSVEEVAADTGLELTHLKVLMRSRLFQTEMERARERWVSAHATMAKEQIWAKAPQAVGVVGEIMDDPKHKDRLNAAKTILDRVVPVKTDSRSEPTVVINITAEKLAALDTVLAEYTEIEVDSNSVQRPAPPSGSD